VGRLERQRERLARAEAATLAHYGVEATAERIVLDDPPVSTRVLRCGDGPPTLLLHGSTTTSVIWAPLLPHLPGRSLALVDLPGCGWAAPFDHDGHDLATLQAGFVTGVLDRLGWRRAALVGASMGGWFALRTALTDPDRVTRLVVVTAPALALPGARVPLPMALADLPVLGSLARLAPPPSARTTRWALAAVGGRGSVRGAPTELFDAVGAAMALGQASERTLGPQLFRGRTVLPGVAVTHHELAMCPVPTLFVWGRDDIVQPPEAGHRAAASMPHGRCEVVPGGHGLWFDDPQRCGRLVTGFLGD
jgi:pimeloyl-ACP methyl ester carboxylesterase